MLQFVQATEQALAEDNLYAALMLAVALPDMCGAIAYPDEEASGDRYRMWWARYMEPSFSAVIDMEFHLYLGGGDAWALRSALLHYGLATIEGQRARETLRSFEFVAASPNVTLHQRDQRLEIGVPTFCAAVLAGVRLFLMQHSADPRVQRELAGLVTIRRFAS